MSDTGPAEANDDLVGRVVLSGAVGVIVGAVAAFSGVGVVVLVIAVLAAIAGFWLLDAVLAPARDAHRGVVHGVSGGTLPSTDTQSLSPPRGVEPPTTGEPVDSAATPSPVEKHGATLDPALFDPASVEVRSNAEGRSRVFSVRIAKHGNTIAECEDAVAVDARRGVLAVADGASSSFGAGVWADTLTRQFVEAPPKPLSIGAFAEWLGRARTAAPDAAVGSEDDRNGWWSERGVRQGAFSTVVGAAIMTDGGSRVATVMCLGDSCAFVLTGAPGARVVRRSLPYEDAEQFGSHPSLLASMPDRQHDEPTWTTVPTVPGDLVVLASDAVSEWLLADPKRFRLLDGNEPEAIATRLVAERTDGRMVNDDLTVVVLELAP